LINNLLFFSTKLSPTKYGACPAAVCWVDETTGEAVCPLMLEYKGAVGIYVERERRIEGGRVDQA